ncbi:uncharacterized protein LOC111897991 [Lactuca sativa]|uniref:AAA+ ATPase domain-containing protein n=1 Tax=Lactuca sativa TaxID=4236 RepID=A0A9R1UKP9_LACSA|nr:uncharacterized protein LOC111897991 [Lactuca sativa]KAJ0188924.1 hypothetical protein LSAT_V11C900491420 [Lactuca sativa]
MNEEQESEPLSKKVSRGFSAVNLTIKISTSTHNPRKEISINDIVSASSISSSSSYSSSSSSAFVSALQSPYISPRATGDDPCHHLENKIIANPSTITTFTQTSTPESHCGSHSDDMPSTSDDFSDSAKLKIVDCVPVTCPDNNTNNATVPRISFSFPVTRIPFAKGSSSAKLRSCDIYIGYHGQNPNLIRFCKWLKSELELQGIACFVADRAKYEDSQSHEIADRVICSVTFGIVVVTKHSLLNHLASEEIRYFAQKKNLIPVFFDTNLNEVSNVLGRNSDGKDCNEAIEWLMKFHEFKLEANEGNWRSCVCRSVGILTGKLGRKSTVAEKETENNVDEMPFPKNRFFIGREEEIAEIETTLFGETEIEFDGIRDGKLKEPNSDVTIAPLIGKHSVKRPKPKHKKTKSFRSSVVCINGEPGMGKTEVALEFAHRYSRRYKLVIWVGGESQHLSQNLLNLSLHLGLDVSADSEKERGRIRSFDELETEAFKRVKRELFRDIPYLLIIDNLETEKDLHNLIQGNTGSSSSHVIITTRLEKVMKFEPMQLQPLPLSDAMMLIKGRRTKEYSFQDDEILRKFDEKLGRSSFGLSVIGSLLSEITISPFALFQAIDQIPKEATSHFDEPFWGNNQFLLKVLIFCVTILQEAKGIKNHLALRMLLTGAWFSPSLISPNLLAVASTHMTPCTKNRFKKCVNSGNFTLFCSSGFIKSYTWKKEEDSALVLVKLGLVRRSNNQYSTSCIMFHPITQVFGKKKGGLLAAKAMVYSIRKIGNPMLNSNHLWASVFLVFGFKTTPPLVQLKALDMVYFIKKIALPLALCAFTTFSRCNSALELLKVCTNVLEEVEKSFESKIEDWCRGSLCWKKKKKTNMNMKIDEYVCQDVTLLKATLLETRAKLLLRGGHFDYGEELCRTCISIRTVMLGHNHAQTLAAQETLSKLVRMRSKM